MSKNDRLKTLQYINKFGNRKKFSHLLSFLVNR